MALSLQSSLIWDALQEDTVLTNYKCSQGNFVIELRIKLSTTYRLALKKKLAGLVENKAVVHARN